MIFKKINKRQYKIEKIRPGIPIKKIYWEFHKGDNDFNPTVPHGHSLNGRSLDGRYKLELWSGKIYEEKNGKLFGVAKAKGMSKLYRRDGFLEFVDECRREYEQKYPSITLQPLTPNEEFALSKIFMKHRAVRKHNKKDGFIFSTEYEKQ